MANKYNRWVPTAYVPLPIDYYKSALMYKEQEAQQSLDKMEAILSGYGSIEPLSKDAQALYDQTTEKLRTGIQDLAKQKLDTPAAQRAAKKLVNDPDIANTYDRILSDAVYGAEFKKKLNTYFEKNPEINAADHLSLVAKMNAETGKNPEKFDYTRFKNVAPLTQYYDLNKKIEDGIKALHSDSRAMQDIIGDPKTNTEYYVNGKVTALGEAKIRGHIISMLADDPQAIAQLGRNMRYTGYKMNPTDIDAGINLTGEAYKMTMVDKEKTIAERLAKLYTKADGTRMTDPEITVTRMANPQFAAEDNDIANEIQTLSRYKKIDPLTKKQDWLDNQTMASLYEKDKLVTGFDAMAWRETEEGRKYSPWELMLRNASLDFDYWKKKKQAEAEIELNTIMDAYIELPGPRNQDLPTPQQYADYIKKVPGMDKVYLGPNGEFEPGNYKKDIATVQGEKYLKRDLWEDGRSVSAGPGGGGPPDPENWTYVEKTHNPRTDASWGVYIRKNAQPFTDTGKTESQLYEEATGQIQKFLTDHHAIGNYDLKNDSDRRKAIADIIRFNRETESTYSPMIFDPTSADEGRVTRFVNSLALSKIYKLNESSGKLEEVDHEAASKKIRTYAGENKNKMGIWLNPVSTIGKTTEMVTVDGENYYVESSPGKQNAFAGANNTVKELISPGDPVRKMRDGTSLFVKIMGKDGEPLTGVLKGGATQRGQDLLRVTYEANVNKVMQESGLPRDQAESAINNMMRTEGGVNTIQVGPNNKWVTIPYPVGKFKGGSGTLYYALGGDDQNGIPFQSIDQVIKGSVKIANSPYDRERALDLYNMMRAATKERILMGGGQQIQTNNPILKSILSDPTYQ